MTGNGQRDKLVGVDMFNLMFFIVANPDASLEEMAIDIYNCGGGASSFAHHIEAAR